MAGVPQIAADLPPMYQWCDDVQASIHTRHGGSFWKQKTRVRAATDGALDHLAGASTPFT
jgi:hypothetical protein